MELVNFSKNGKPATTSRKVAEKFGKDHSKVLAAIKNLKCSTKFTEANFGLSEYEDATGRTLPEYIISRDGFSFLVMGFTGKKAAEFKEEFIDAFNLMEESLKSQVALSPAQLLLQQCQLLVDQERRISTVETKLDILIGNQQKATEQLQLIERSTVALPEESLRDKIRRVVNTYVAAKNAKHQDVWRKIYESLYYKYHISINSYKKMTASENKLDIAERTGHLDKIFNIVSQELKA